MRTAQDIILKPVITEDSMDRLQANRYTFKVAKDANKIEIAKAVEELFNVKVTVQNLEIVKVDAENNLIAIKGAIPGPKNGTVTICDCVKKA